MHIIHTHHQLSIARSAHSPPILVQQARPDQRPYIHPILAPDGRGILTEDVPPHHPWQHGLYTGLNDVNGIGFWTEGLRGSASDGTFHPRRLTAPLVDGNKVDWTVITDWRAPDGLALLTERQMWAFVDHGDSYTLWLTWGLHAQIDVTFGQYAYGGLFLRMPFRTVAGGEAINSEGQINNMAEQQQARWMAASMPLIDRDEEWAGIAILDHPMNPQHPTPWRVDNQLGIGPSPSSVRSWQLGKDETIYFSYALFVFCGQTNPARVEAQWQNYRTM